MSDTKEKKTKLSLRPGKLELEKTVKTGQVKQSFSHGRSKMVTVEVKKKRTFKQGASGKMAEVESAAAPAEPEAKPTGLAKVAAAFFAPSGKDDTLTQGEKATRQRVLDDAMSAPAERTAAPRQTHIAPVERPPELTEPTPPVLTPEEIEAEAEAQQKREKQAKAAAKAAAAKIQAGEADPEESKSKASPRARRPHADEKKPTRPVVREEKRRGSGKLTLNEALNEGEGRQRSLAAVKRARAKEKQKQAQLLPGEERKIVRDVVVPETITVQELANRMAVRTVDVIKVLMGMDMMSSADQVIDADTAELVVGEFGHKLKRVSESDVEIGLTGIEDTDADMESRAPVVTIMGHVDHGKTSLLDALRETDVAEGEAGGITQHIGAYQVTLEAGQKITFIDTPGHAAFTDMRARGAEVTDIVVLVVAADDSVMPQTIEAIHHARAAEVPIIIAINKCDKPDANAQKVRNELLQHDIVVEQMGGEILDVEVSAKAKTGLDKLEEAILLQAEILDLKANPNRPGEGVVVEARMEPGRGSVATVLVQRGSMKQGEIFVAGAEWGRVRALINDHGDKISIAGPGMPVEILGLGGTPQAGDQVVVVDSESRAREVSEFRQRRGRMARHAASARGTLEQMFDKIKEGTAEELPIVIKADVHGSLEAIEAALNNMATEEVRVRILHSAVGGINESDIILARASGAPVIGFNVRANAQARELSRRDGVDIRYYSIIYDLTDDLKKVLSGMLSPTIRENFIGYAEIREVFNVSKVGKIAGCMVTEGNVKRGAKVRLLRDDVVIHEGDLSQLKRFKDDAKEVSSGTECGMAFANYQDLQKGDMVECFEVEEIARELK